MALASSGPTGPPTSFAVVWMSGAVVVAAAIVIGHATLAVGLVAVWLVALQLLLIRPVAVAVGHVEAGTRRAGSGARDGLAALGRAMNRIGIAARAELRRIIRSIADHPQLVVACSVGSLGSLVLIGPAMWRMAHGRANGYLANDWLPFIQAVDETRFWPLRLTTPHFVFPTVGAVVEAATRTTPATATALTGIASVGITGAVLVWFFHRPWAPGGRPLPLVVAVATALAFEVSDLPQYLFFGREALTFDRLNVSLHQWNTPSSLAVEWMQLVLLVSVARLAGDAPPSRRWIGWVAVLTLVTTLTLPAIPAALAVGTPLWLWRLRRLDRLRPFVYAVVIPLIVAFILATIESTLWLKPGWNPPLVFQLGGSLIKLDLWGPGLGLLVPVGLVALMGWRSFARSVEVRLVGWSLLWGLVLLLTVALGGPRANEGNIGRVTFAVSWVGYLYMVRWALELARGWRTWMDWSWRLKLATPLVLAYVGVTMTSGILMLLEQSGVIVFTGATI